MESAITRAGKRGHFGAIPWLVAALLWAGAAEIVRAEDSKAPVAAEPQAAGQQTVLPSPPASERPGFLHQLGAWWEDGLAKMKETKKKLDNLNKNSGDAAKGAADATQDAVKNAAEAAKTVTTTVVRLPSTRLVEVREICVRAPNGAPDCPAAANNICHNKGFSSGRPLDVSTVQECPPAALLSGRMPTEAECPVETRLLRVVCQ